MKLGRGSAKSVGATNLPGQGANAIDTHVGMRIRICRTLHGLSQERIARRLGLKSQTIQKYESGEVRVTAGRLHALSQVLGVPVQFFFDGLNTEYDRGYSGISSPEVHALLSKILTAEDAIEFNSAFLRIDDADVRQSVLGLIRGLACSPSNSNV